MSGRRVMKKDSREEELQLFKELNKREKDRAASLLQPISSDDFEANHSFYRIPSVKKEASNYDFFSSANAAKSDYDWLKTPPATPLFPSLEMEATGPPPSSLLLQREITIVQPLSRFSACSSSDATMNTITTTTSSRPNIPTGASFRQSGQPPSITNLNSTVITTTTTAAAAEVKNYVKVTEPTPDINRNTSGGGGDGIGKSNKLLQYSRRSSNNNPPPPMRLVDRASSASRVRPPTAGVDGPAKPSTANSIISKPRRHSVTRSSVIPTNTSTSSNRQSSTKTSSLSYMSQQQREKFQTTSSSKSSSSGSRSNYKYNTTSKITGNNKQIFGSKMVDKVMSARKAADDESKAAAAVAIRNNPPTSPGLGFGRLSAPRNMELKRDRIVSSRAGLERR